MINPFENKYPIFFNDALYSWTGGIFEYRIMTVDLYYVELKEKLSELYDDPMAFMNTLRHAVAPKNEAHNI